MSPELVAAFGNFGPLGLMIFYLIWNAKSEREERQLRTAADIELAKSLTALTVTIQHIASSPAK
jgi:hypothetical protein